jgi:predicted ribosome-associated RNA-binding protein Tma20
MIYPVFRCDKGALKFIINGRYFNHIGANVMCPGLTHPNATM